MLGLFGDSWSYAFFMRGFGCAFFTIRGSIMRIGVGKKIGNFYVGTSVSGKKAANGMAMLFLWPFYLMYYVCIWPFVALIKYLSKNTGQGKSLSAAESDSVKRVILSTAKVLSETKKPDTFFSRLDLLNDNINKLKESNKSAIGKKKEKEAISELEKEIPGEINSFIDRYAKETRLKIYDLATEKAKINKANAFKNILMEYSDKMTPDNIEYCNKVADDLIKIATE